MHFQIRITREGSGRFLVMCGERRAGTVLGGGANWSAETPAGSALGRFSSKARAIEALVAHVAQGR